MNALGKSMSKIVKLLNNKSGQLDPEQFKIACNHLNQGGIIAIPTDTIYGLAAKASDSNALNRIYKIKERDTAKPLAVCVSCPDEVPYIADTSKLDKRILRSLLPGPITILLNRSESLNKDLNPNFETVGIRVPNHDFPIELSAAVGPIALTSANRSGETSPLLAEDFEELWPEIDCVFDNGILQKRHPDEAIPVNQRLGSTVVDLTQPRKYTIVRKGCALNRTVSILNRFGYRRVDEPEK